MKVGDRVLVKDNKDNKWIGTIININPFREPSQMYCVDLDSYSKDYVFVSEKELELVEENISKSRQVRKQVCDEIREKAIHTKTGYMGFTEKGYYTIYAGDLERIEKGEWNE